MIEIILWLITAISSPALILQMYEHLLNNRRIPPEERPAFLENIWIQYYQIYGAFSMLIIPWFAVWKWGWWGLTALQIYPAVCAVFSLLLVLPYGMKKREH